MEIKKDFDTDYWVIRITEKELHQGGIALLIKRLAHCGVERGNLPTFSDTREEVNSVGVLTYDEHNDERLPKEYAYITLDHYTDLRME